MVQVSIILVLCMYIRYKLYYYVDTLSAADVSIMKVKLFHEMAVVYQKVMSRRVLK